MIPERNRVRCEFCGFTLDRTAPGVYRRLAGWARNRAQGGPSSVILPEREERWACAACIDAAKHVAVTWQQLDLFDP